jgi:ribose transport system substrate-binding protein
MYELASNPDLDAIVSVGGWPMWVEPATRWKEFVDANRHLLLFVADALPVQVELINEGYGDALVGQKPFDMGELIIQTLARRNEDDMAEIEEMMYTGEQIFFTKQTPSAAFYSQTIVLSLGLVVSNIIALFM